MVKFYVESYVTNKECDDQSVDLKDWQFDQWQQLYEKDPTLFEKNRLKLFQQFIEQAPNKQQNRLKGLLFTMEGEKRRSRTIASEQSRYLALMLDQLSDLNTQLTALLHFEKPNLISKQSNAKVLEFKKDKNQQ